MERPTIPARWRIPPSGKRWREARAGARRYCRARCRAGRPGSPARPARRARRGWSGQRRCAARPRVAPVHDRRRPREPRARVLQSSRRTRASCLCPSRLLQRHVRRRPLACRCGIAPVSPKSDRTADCIGERVSLALLLAPFQELLEQPLLLCRVRAGARSLLAGCRRLAGLLRGGALAAAICFSFSSAT